MSRMRYRARVPGRYLALLIAELTEAERVSQNELARRAGIRVRQRKDR